jgi:hypothetical protein
MLGVTPFMGLNGLQGQHPGDQVDALGLLGALEGYPLEDFGRNLAPVSNWAKESDQQQSRGNPHCCSAKVGHHFYGHRSGPKPHSAAGEQENPEEATAVAPQGRIVGAEEDIEAIEEGAYSVGPKG